MAYKTVNPFNGQVVKSYPDLSDADLQVALSRAEKAYETEWSFERFPPCWFPKGPHGIIRQPTEKFTSGLPASRSLFSLPDIATMATG